MTFALIVFSLWHSMWTLGYLLFVQIAKGYCLIVGRPYPKHPLWLKIFVFMLVPLCWPPNWMWLLAIIIVAVN